jgi:hypothetical protein
MTRKPSSRSGRRVSSVAPIIVLLHVRPYGIERKATARLTL